MPRQGLVERRDRRSSPHQRDDREDARVARAQQARAARPRPGGGAGVRNGAGVFGARTRTPPIPSRRHRRGSPVLKRAASPSYITDSRDCGDQRGWSGRTAMRQATIRSRPSAPSAWRRSRWQPTVAPAATLTTPPPMPASRPSKGSETSSWRRCSRSSTVPPSEPARQPHASSGTGGAR